MKKLSLFWRKIIEDSFSKFKVKIILAYIVSILLLYTLSIHMFGILSVNLLDTSVCQFSYSGLQCVNTTVGYIVHTLLVVCL